MTLVANLEAAVTDAAVTFDFTVENAGDSPVELTFRDGRTADVRVEVDGEEVWRWSDGRMFTQAIQTRRLPPGSVLTEAMRWDAPEPNSYQAIAWLTAEDVDASARVEFTV